MDTKTIIRSQYHAVLRMLLQAVEKCPSDMWANPQDRNKFWHVAYHALFYTHLYLSTNGSTFKPWIQHREDYEFMGRKPWPPHDLPQIGEPYCQADILTFWQVCWDFVEMQVAALELDAPSGFEWLPMNKLELQIYNIRHIQQHTGELMERLGRQGIDIDWVGNG